MSDKQSSATLFRQGLVHHSSSGWHPGRLELHVHPEHKTFAKWYDRYMIFVALFGAIFIYLQAITILKNKSSENVSLPSHIVFLIVSLSWMAYGILWADWVVAVSGMIASIGAIFALVATIAYRPTHHPGAFVPEIAA